MERFPSLHLHEALNTVLDLDWERQLTGRDPDEGLEQDASNIIALLCRFEGTKL